MDKLKENILFFASVALAVFFGAVMAWLFIGNLVDTGNLKNQVGQNTANINQIINIINGSQSTN